MEELTPEQQAHVDFLASIERFKHPANGAYYAWVESPVANLEALIPEGIKWSCVVTEYDQEGNPIETRQKTISEFVLSVELSKDATMCMCSLAAMESPALRHKIVTWEDIKLWKTHIEPHGFTIDKWLDINQHKAKLLSEDYLGEV